MKIIYLIIISNFIVYFAMAESPTEIDPVNHVNKNSAVSSPDLYTTPVIQGIRGDFLSVADKYLEKNVLHKPGLNINAYTGDVRTSFQIPLFVNNTTFKSLNITYNSSRIANDGLGYGMKLEIPKLLIKADGSIYTEQGGDELIVFDLSTHLPTARINLILSKMKLTSTGAVTWFRTQSLENKKLFAKVETTHGIVFMELDESGENIIYNSTGEVTNIFNLHSRGISFNYDNHKLSTIQNNDYATSAILKHDATSGLLKSITVNDTNNLNKQIFRFFYDDNKLIKVKKDGAVKTLFLGKYKKISFPSIVANSGIKIGVDQKLIFNSNSNTPTGVKNAQEEVYVNINADRFTDKIVSNYSSVIREIKNYMSKVKLTSRGCGDFYKCLKPKPNEISNFINSRPIIYKTYIAVLNENNSIEYKEDKSLEMSLNFSELNDFKLNLSSEKLCTTRKDTTYCYLFETIKPEIEVKKIVRYADLDQDGLKDMFLCTYDKKLDDQTVVMRNGDWDGQKQNSLSYGLFQFLKNNDQTLFNANGATATVFLQRADRKKLLTDLKQKMSNSDLMINHSKWIPSNINFKCHQNSIFGDLTNDNKLSILTGHELTTILNDQSVKTNIISLDQIKNLFNPITTDLDASTMPLELVEATGNGKLDLIYSYGNYVDPITRELKLVQNNGQELVIKRTPHVPVLVEEESTFGGIARIDYTYSAAGLIGKSLTIKPTTKLEDAYKIDYTYTGTKIHESSNTFLGFKKSMTVKSYLTNNNHIVVEENVFDQDNSLGPVYIGSRARKNGRIQSTIIKDQLNDESSISVVKSADYKYNDKEIQDFFSYSYLEESHDFNLTNGKTIQTFNPNNFNTYLIPEKNVSIISSVASDSKKITTTQSSFDLNNYLLSSTIINVTDQSGAILSPVEEVHYLMGLKSNSKTGAVSTNFQYDSYGRATMMAITDGNIINYLYNNNHSLNVPDAIISNGSIKNYQYDLVSGHPLRIQTENESPMYYQWNNDDILTTVTKNQTQLFGVSNFSTNKIQYTMIDRSFSYDLDGFGRFEFLQEYNTAKKSWDNIWSKQFDFNDKVKEKNDYFLNSNGDDFKTNFNLHADGSLKSETTLNMTKGFTERVNTIRIDRNIEKDNTLYVHKNINDSINEEDWISGIQGVVGRVDSFGEYEFNKDSNGKIIGINNLNISYTRDLNGNVTTSQKTGLNAWEKLGRTIDLNEQKTKYSSGTIEKNILNSLPSSYESQKENGDVHFSDNRLYTNGKVISRSMKFGALNFSESFKYNNENQMTNYYNSILSKTFEYDHFGRVINESISIGPKKISLNYQFQKGQVTEVIDIMKVIYDRQDRVAQVNFTNGVTLTFKYNYKGQVESKTFAFAMGKKIESINYERDINGKIKNRISRLIGNNSYVYSNEKLVSTDSHSLSTNITSNNYSSLLASDDLLLNWNKNELRSINNINFYNGFDQHFTGACASDTNHIDKCLIKLSDNEYLYDGHYYRRMKFGSTTIAVLVDDTIYPAITDHNDTLLGLISADGSTIEFLRKFNDFGIKLSVSGNKVLEKNVPFSFGNLIQIPQLNGLVLQSMTRVYVPSINQWASIDTAAVWNPELLLGNPGNWNALEYASGDPVNKVDASGTYSPCLVGMGIGAAVGGLSEVLMSTNNGKEYVKDIGKGILVGGTTGFFAGMTSSTYLTRNIVTGFAFGTVGSIYRLSLDNKDITTPVSLTKIGAAAILGGIIGGLSTFAPIGFEKFMSSGLGMTESFFGGSANAVIDKVNEIQTQQQGYLDKLNRSLK